MDDPLVGMTRHSGCFGSRDGFSLEPPQLLRRCGGIKTARAGDGPGRPCDGTELPLGGTDLPLVGTDDPFGNF